MELIRSYSMSLGKRVTVKGFRDSDSMHRFLCTGGNALSWRIVSEKELRSGLKKPGSYIERGFEFLNTRNIDPSALAHIG